MSRGIRKDTPERIALAREREPLAIGPLLGDLCTQFNITASMVATYVGSHDQTVLRWFFGNTAVTPQWITPVVKLICVLDWMRINKMEPLSGTVEQKTTALGKTMAAFVKLTKRAA